MCVLFYNICCQFDYHLQQFAVQFGVGLLRIGYWGDSDRGTMTAATSVRVTGWNVYFVKINIYIHQNIGSETRLKYD